jgi:hypothetical protein
MLRLLPDGHYSAHCIAHSAVHVCIAERAIVIPYYLEHPISRVAKHCGAFGPRLVAESGTVVIEVVPPVFRLRLVVTVTISLHIALL